MSTTGDRISKLAASLQELVDPVRKQQGDLGSCQVRMGAAEEGLQRCEARAARAPTAVVPAPEGRTVYGGCYAGMDPAHNPVMTLVGTIPESDTDPVAVVAECARMVSGRALNGQPVTFGVQNGNECWVSSKNTADAMRGGGGLTNRCTLRPDVRGQQVGGKGAMSVYTLYARGLEARYLRIVRRVATPAVQPEPKTADLHIVGVAVLNEAGEPWPWRAVQTAPGPPLADDGGDATVDAVLQRHRPPLVLGSLTGMVRMGPEIGNQITFDLGDVRRILGVHLRNRTSPKPGTPEIEDRLRGCWVQLMVDAGAAPVWERPITFGAPSYQWEVR